jgi:hypothetical protein
MDLSFGWIKSTDRTVQWLSENRLSQCIELNLTSWKNLTNAGVKVSNLTNAGVKVSNLTNAGIKVSNLTNAGVTVSIEVVCNV